MLITAKSALGKKVRALDIQGNVIGTAFAADTTAGWLDLYVLRPPAQATPTKVLQDRKERKLVTIRVHTDFDIVTRRGRKLFSVRWTWSGPPKVFTKKHGPLPK